MDMSHQNNARGVTMLELVVVLTIGAILIAVAIPSFVRTKRHLELQGASQALVGDLRTSQANAIRQGITSTLDYSNTSQSYQDYCNDNSCTPTDGLNNPAASISFNANGYVSAPASMPFTVTMKSCQTGETLKVQVERTGRIKTLTAAASAC
jgi:prepilin-type N-terminal cleavage/methylation domain-containing protein